jgi:hypothetical protein
VRFVGVFLKEAYPDYSPDDLIISQPDVVNKINEAPYASDLTTGEAINTDLGVRHKMMQLLTIYKPHLIHIEQVYPYYGLVPLMTELNVKPKLVYGSQNIEYTMKQKIYEGLRLPEDIAKATVKKIKDLEESFSREADLVITVNEADAKSHREMGAKKVFVAPNGIDKVIPSKQATSYWQKFKRDNAVKQVLTFISSAHPPNWEGFLSMVGDDLKFVPDGAKIFIAGGVADYFIRAYNYGAKSHKAFWDKVVPVERPSDDKLSGLIRESELILLPITTPRGSNLKTAEAILSGKKIVATKYAFRGFEEYNKLPNIYIANTQEEFRRSIIKALNSEYIVRAPQEVDLAQHVQWQYCLAPLRPALKNLLRNDFLSKLVNVAAVQTAKYRKSFKRIIINAWRKIYGKVR